MDTEPRTQNEPRTRSPGRVVVGVDGTRTALDAVRWAAAEARLRGLDLRILHAAPYARGPEGPGSLRARSILGVAFTAAHRAAPGLAVSTRSTPADPAPALIAAAETADLVVVGIPATDSPYELLPTSVALDVAGHATGPVAVVRGRLRAHDEPVLVGVDEPVADAAVLDAAFAEAALHRTGLVVLQARAGLREHLPHHAEHDEQRTARLTAALRDLSDRYPEVAVTVSTPHEDATTALLAAAHRARLLVVGTRRRGAAARVVFGSHSRAVLRHSPVPVLVVDPDARASTRGALHATPADAT